jgi:hypothetical protein
MMRTMLIAATAAVLLLADDAAAQRVDGGVWRTPMALAVPDPRLRPDIAASPAEPSAEVRASRLSLVQVAAVGVVVGCVTGALVMGSGGDARDRAPRRFNGCIVGASIGGFAGGVYGLATGR